MESAHTSQLSPPGKHSLWPLVLLLYAGLSLTLTLHHEIWKDEAHHWLLAKDSDNLRALFFNARYEGHPLLWNIVLFLITRFTDNPLWMQLVHWAVMVGSVAVLLLRSPFPAWVKYSLPFTYLILYEYQALSRNYALCFLFLFLICSLLNKEKPSYLKLSLLLILLANTHLFGLVCAAMLLLTLLYARYKDQSHNSERQQSVQLVVVCSVGFLLAVVQIIPPSDHFLTTHHNEAGLLSATRIGKFISIFFRGVFHLPNIWTEGPWNKNLFLMYLPDAVKALLSLIGWLLPTLLFFRNKRVLFLFYSSAGVIAAFAYLSPLLLAVRHSGFLFLLLVCCLWLVSSPLFKSGPDPVVVHKRLLLSVIGLSIISSVLMSHTEIKRPFSQSRKLVAFIKSSGLEHLPVVSTQNTGPSLSAQLRKPLYYADKNDYGSYAVWSAGAFILDRQLIDQNVMAFSKQHDEFLIASEYDYEMLFAHPCYRIEKLDQFEAALVPSENFLLYKITRLCKEEESSL